MRQKVYQVQLWSCVDYFGYFHSPRNILDFDGFCDFGSVMYYSSAGDSVGTWRCDCSSVINHIFLTLCHLLRFFDFNLAKLSLTVSIFLSVHHALFTPFFSVTAIALGAGWLIVFPSSSTTVVWVGFVPYKLVAVTLLSVSSTLVEEEDWAELVVIASLVVVPKSAVSSVVLKPVVESLLVVALVLAVVVFLMSTLPSVFLALCHDFSGGLLF